MSFSTKIEFTPGKVMVSNRYRAAQLVLKRNGLYDPYSDERHPEDAGPLLIGMPLALNPGRN
jgi:hypothetical protein